MRRNIILPFLLIGFVFSSAFSLQAENQDKTLYGQFLLGYRLVDNSGADFKYREDINLDEGIRLFNFSLSYTPNAGKKNIFDRPDLNIYNFGGDPYETLGIAVQKYGLYKFRYDRRKSDYFYHDLHEVDGGQLLDPLVFDFERVSDNVFFKLWINKNIDLFLNFDRYSKKGNSEISLDLNRIEFEFDKPISEDYKSISFGLDAHYKGYSFLFKETIMDYENSNSFFLPGSTDGGPGSRYPSSLDFFVLNQPYDLKSYTHTFKIKARPFDSLLVSGSARISDLDMDLAYSEESKGVDYLGRVFSESFSGEGAFERKIRLYDTDVTYILFDRLAVIGAFRYHDFEQDGSLTKNGGEQDMLLNYDTLGIEAGLQFQFLPNLALTAGYRHEERNLEGTETVTYEEETIRNGFFGNLKWDPTKAIKLTADYQRSSYDDSFTLISPTSFNRLKVTAKIRAEEFNFSGSYLWNRTKSEVYDDLYESTKNQISLRTGYHGKQIKAFAGYTLINVQHEADRTIVFPPSWSGPGTFPWEILYEGKSHLLDASLNVKVNAHWSLGAYGNLYWNNGFWEIDRTMLKGYVEYLFENGLVAQAGYRFVDFEEAFSGFNDYQANIFELSFGYRWQ